MSAPSVFPENFPPSSRAELGEFEDRLIAGVAQALGEPPARGALAARSEELLPLVDDVVADWTAVILASEGNDRDTHAQLLAVARHSSEALAEMVESLR